MKDIVEQLREYTAGDMYPMHMPGHKRNPKFQVELGYDIDVTEVPGTDNLHAPEGMLREGMNRMAKAYGADRSFYLVNGSTAGIQIAIASCCRLGDTIWMARNCHKAVYNMVCLLGLRPRYIFPEVDAIGICRGISLEDVKAMGEDKPSCVILTSPTYEGYLSDIRAIAEYLHENDIPLIVDEAHGAHFIWHSRFPESAVRQGADFVIQSFHKTLPSPTQTGVLHWNRGRVEEERVLWNEQMFQTSSPSYLLMAGMDHGLCLLLQNGTKLFSTYIEHLDAFYDRMKVLKHLRVIPQTSDRDISKVMIATTKASCTGEELARWLREDKKIETEMALSGYVLAMTSVADTEEGFHRLGEALFEADRTWQAAQHEKRYEWQSENDVIQKMLPGAALALPMEQIPCQEAVGRIAGQYVYHYPPGIPVIAPGEQITEALLEKITFYGEQIDQIRVVTS